MITQDDLGKYFLNGCEPSLNEDLIKKDTQRHIKEGLDQSILLPCAN